MHARQPIILLRESCQLGDFWTGVYTNDLVVCIVNRQDRFH